MPSQVSEPMSKLSDLMQRRRSLAAQIAALNKDLQDVDQLLSARVGKLVEAIEGPQAEEAGGALFVVTRHGGTTIRRATSAPERDRAVSVVRARELSLEGPILRCLAEQKRPMHTRELLTHLKRQGVEVRGKNPQNTLSAHLSYMGKDKLMRTPDGWTLKQHELLGSEKQKAAH